MEKAEFKAEAVGPGLFVHNYYCAACHVRPAVYFVNRDLLLPCWIC